MSNGDFWDEMGGAYIPAESGFDAVIQGREINGSAFTGVRELTRTAIEANALPLPVEAGTRVQFANTLDAALTYSDIPEAKVAGTVVTVRTGSGDTTYLDGRVFVAWDDGVFRPMAPEHLRLSGSSRQAKTVRVVVSDLGDLSSFFASSARSGDDLIHKATKDLWAVKKLGDKYAIERLFDADGEPLKGV